MNKYINAAFCCGLLISGGKSSAAGVELLERLDQENIIGNEKKPFSTATPPTPSPILTSPDSTQTPRAAPKDKTTKLPVRSSKPVACPTITKDDRPDSITRGKLTRLASDLQKAQVTIDELTKKLADAQSQKGALEKAKKLQAEDEAKQLALEKKLAETSAQKLALESLLATLKADSGGDKQENSQLTGQLNTLTAEKTELSRQLVDLEKKYSDQLKIANAEKVELNKQLADLQQKSADELNATTVQKTELNKQLTELKKKYTDLLTVSAGKSDELNRQHAELMKKNADLDSQLTELKKQKVVLEQRITGQDNQIKNDRTSADLVVGQLAEAKKTISAQEAELAALKTNSGSEKEKTVALTSKLSASDVEITGLKKRLEKLNAQNAIMTQKLTAQDKVVDELTKSNQKLKSEQTALSSWAAAKETPASKRVIVSDTATKDTRTSYAVGAWYGNGAVREQKKLIALGKKFDQSAFVQGFNDKLNNQMQLAADKVSSELIELDKLQTKHFSETRTKNEKQSKAILAKAMQEQGAVKTADGSVYRIITKGTAPLVTLDNNIITEVDEVLGTGKVMSSKEVRASRVRDLPPLFQTVVQKLGLDGQAKIHIPAKEAYGDAGVPGFVPPGTISIITIKVIAIK